jgi:hypothetical protein
MEGFHAAVQHFRKAGVPGNVRDRQTGLSKGPGCAACREDLNPEFGKGLHEIGHACFIGHTDNRPLDFSHLPTSVKKEFGFPRKGNLKSAPLGSTPSFHSSEIPLGDYDNPPGGDRETLAILVGVVADLGVRRDVVVLVNDGLLDSAITAYDDVVANDGLVHGGPASYHDVVGKDGISDNAADDAARRHKGVERLAHPEAFGPLVVENELGRRRKNLAGCEWATWCRKD